MPAAYPIAAIYKNTAPEETSPWVLPGMYTVRLTVDGKVFNQPLQVRMDPRVKISDDELEGIRNLAYLCYAGRKVCMDELATLTGLKEQLKNIQSKAGANGIKGLKELADHINWLQNSTPGNKDRGFQQLLGAFSTLFGVINESDFPPTAQSTEAVITAKLDLSLLETKWKEVSDTEIPAVNKALKKAGLPLLTVHN